MKTCRICKLTLPLREFYRRPRSSDGHRHECKECCRAYERERYQLKREQIRARWKRYSQTEHGRAVILAYRRSARGLERQRESNRFWRGSRRMEAA